MEKMKRETVAFQLPVDTRGLVRGPSETNIIYFYLFFQMNTIWISCEGENPADIENLGPITYIPQRGFPGFFFPYENSEGYLSPLLAIHIERPRSKNF